MPGDVVDPQRAALGDHFSEYAYGTRKAPKRFHLGGGKTVKDECIERPIAVDEKTERGVLGVHEPASLLYDGVQYRLRDIVVPNRGGDVPRRTNHLSESFADMCKQPLPAPRFAKHERDQHDCQGRADGVQHVGDARGATADLLDFEAHAVLLSRMEVDEVCEPIVEPLRSGPQLRGENGAGFFQTALFQCRETDRYLALESPCGCVNFFPIGAFARIKRQAKVLGLMSAHLAKRVLRGCALRSVGA